jgi:hypothetical protein
VSTLNNIFNVTVHKTPEAFLPPPTTTPKNLAESGQSVYSAGLFKMIRRLP